MYTTLLLIAIIILIILAITKWQLHPFLTLLLAGLLMGLGSGMDIQLVILKLTEGFGNTLKSIGIVIAFGTIIGVFLERGGGTKVMANSVLNLVGEKKSALAMNITGFIVSIPVFCDSGFVILSSLIKALSRKTGISMTVLAVALGTGLYATHVFVPPTPGPLAAAATIGADIGLIIIFGLITAIPVALTGLLWAKIYANRFKIIPEKDDQVRTNPDKNPGKMRSFTPLLIPLILIALKSIAEYPTNPLGEGIVVNICGFIGHPVIALLFGVFSAFLLKKYNSSGTLNSWVGKGIRDAGTIILITGAGGAFGNILRATGVDEFLGEQISGYNIGIFLPFIIAAILKSAQGSSTVAIITTAALISPLIAPLGFDSPIAKALVVLSIGAGAMTVSHLNDNYFWVVSQFSGMDTPTALRCHTMATLIQGITGILIIYFLNIIFI